MIGIENAPNFIIVHRGDGVFEAIMEDGTIRNLGPNTCRMIRYTYFEDYTIPPIDCIFIVKHNNLGPVIVAQAMGEPESLPRVSLRPIYLLV